VFFLDETFEEISYDITTSVSEAVEQVAGIIGLQNYSTFTLFEAQRAVSPKAAAEQMSEEHIILDDHRWGLWGGGRGGGGVGVGRKGGRVEAGV
jgi:hypothetical protein